MKGGEEEARTFSSPLRRSLSNAAGDFLEDAVHDLRRYSATRI